LPMLDLFEGLNKTIEEFHYIVFLSEEINAYSGKHDSPHKNFGSSLKSVRRETKFRREL